MKPATSESPPNSVRQHVLNVLDLLEDVWRNERNPPRLGHDEPLEGLVLTVLSQNTNDKNRDRAYLRLRETFPEWEEALKDPARLAEAIRPAGLSSIKSGRIVDILEKVRETFGEISLRALRTWEPARIVEFLRSFAGVGPKTIACVLLFDLEIPAFPVDTHIARFTRRMKWAPEKARPEDMSAFYEEIVPKQRFLGAHVNIIHHGRSFCSARNPKCASCPIRDICPAARRFI